VSRTKVTVYPVTLGPFTTGVLSPFNTLGCLVAYAKTHDQRALLQDFDFAPITPFGPEAPDVLRKLEAGPPAVILLSSYIWNHDFNMAFARLARACSPGSLVVIGGPHIPRSKLENAAFLHAHPEVDVTARNEGEVTFAEILRTIALDGRGYERMRLLDFSSVTGIAFRDEAGKVVRTEDRDRTRDLSIFPSPFLTGEFDHWILDGKLMPIETNRGCPYGCTFCDWGAATLSKIHPMSDERVYGEIEFAGMKRLAYAGFCDANFGILPRDVDIAKHMIAVHERYGWPKETGFTSAKVATPRLLEIAKLLHRAGLIKVMQSSFQTTDVDVLEIIARSNIRLDQYDKMTSFYRKEGIPTGADLMIGLPGQTLETVRNDLQFVFDRRLNAVLYACTVMPNAPMNAEPYKAKYQIRIDAEGFVESTFSFDKSTYARIFDLCLAYKFLVKIGVAKYLLYLLQLDRGVKALDFISRWVERASGGETKYPLSSAVWARLLRKAYTGGVKHWLVIHWTHEEASFLFDDIGAFHRELLQFYRDEFGVSAEGSDVDAVLEVQRAVMPGAEREDAVLTLKHDVAAFFAALKDVDTLEPLPPEHRALATYPSGTFALKELDRARYDYADLNTLVGSFELESELRV
jgi:radical SAM superfamily enzyme YgiQ (UPF0313 family)